MHAITITLPFFPLARNISANGLIREIIFQIFRQQAVYKGEQKKAGGRENSSYQY